ncbi:tyrosine-protein phosphatase [Mumia zhuanghuii]|uniref:Tyrosine-protein phosphatase n=2 Tax=Mumia TaxID=1546255 RepID=A0ABW1QR90_9ACTN|nr:MULTISPECIES: tyrosine-protein phosphatase [Mumia]KAA1423791.1 tyrosine-protein phosphatase [Mumia zhuanghuii]
MTEHDRTAPGTPIPVATLPNLRSLAGWRAADGRAVREGVLFRSTDLSRLTGTDTAVVEGLGIRTVVDLRTAPERERRPDVRLDGADEVVLDVLADAVQAAPTDMAEILEDPGRARDLLSDGQARAAFLQAYEHLVTLPSARASYGAFFRVLAAGSGATLFHCTTGKDRTGWAAASTLMLLGVPEEVVEHEYLLTNDQLLPALQPVLDHFASLGGDPDLLLPVLGVRPEYLATSLAVMRRTYGDVATYFADGLGIDAATQAALRERLLVDR